MSETNKPQFDARADAERLRAFASGLTYNDKTVEAHGKHTLHEIAMRLETGGYQLPVHWPTPTELQAKIVQQIADVMPVGLAPAGEADDSTVADQPSELSVAVWEAVQVALGDAYDCTRAWSAWQFGTMSDRDFVPVADQPSRIDEIASAVMQVLPASVNKVHTWADMEAISDEPKVNEALQAFSEDPTSDHAVFVVEAILKALGLQTLLKPEHEAPPEAVEVKERAAAAEPVPLCDETEKRIRQLIDDLLDVEYVGLTQGRHVLHTTGPVTYDGLRAIFVAGAETSARHALATWPVLKGVAKFGGDGFKDPTVKGQVVYVWNQEKPSPYKPGQFPRVGNGSGWTAERDQFEFTAASMDEIVDVLETPLLESKAKLRQITEAIKGYYRAMDERKHAGVAQSAALAFIEEVMGMRWGSGEQSLAAPKADTVTVNASALRRMLRNLVGRESGIELTQAEEEDKSNALEILIQEVSAAPQAAQGGAA